MAVINLDEDVINLDEPEGPPGWEAYMGPPELFGHTPPPTPWYEGFKAPGAVLGAASDWIGEKLLGERLPNILNRAGQEMIPDIQQIQGQLVQDPRGARFAPLMEPLKEYEDYARGGVEIGAEVGGDPSNLAPFAGVPGAVLFGPGMAIGVKEMYDEYQKAVKEGRIRDARKLKAKLVVMAPLTGFALGSGLKEGVRGEKRGVGRGAMETGPPRSVVPEPQPGPLPRPAGRAIPGQLPIEGVPLKPTPGQQLGLPFEGPLEPLPTAAPSAMQAGPPPIQFSPDLPPGRPLADVIPEGGERGVRKQDRQLNLNRPLASENMIAPEGLTPIEGEFLAHSNEMLNHVMNDPRIVAILPGEGRELQAGYSSRIAGLEDSAHPVTGQGAYRYGANMRSESVPFGEILQDPQTFLAHVDDVQAMRRAAGRPEGNPVDIFVKKWIDNIYHEMSHTQDRVHALETPEGTYADSMANQARWKQLYETIKQIDPLRDVREAMLNTARNEQGQRHPARQRAEEIYSQMKAARDKAQAARDPDMAGVNRLLQELGLAEERPEDIAARNAEQLARIEGGETPQVAPPGTRRQVELAQRQKELLAGRANPFDSEETFTSGETKDPILPEVAYGALEFDSPVDKALFWLRQERAKAPEKQNTALIQRVEQELQSRGLTPEDLTSLTPKVKLTKMAGGLGMVGDAGNVGARIATLGLASRTGTVLHNMANLGMVMPATAVTNAGVAAGAKAAAAFHALRGDTVKAARANAKARQYFEMSKRFPIAAISSAGSTLAEAVKHIPVVKEVGAKLAGHTNYAEMQAFQSFLEQTGSKRAAERLAAFSNPDFAARTGLEKAMVLFNVLGDRFAIHTMMDTYGKGLLAKYGVQDMAALETLYKTGTTAQRLALEKDFSIMETNAAKVAFNLATSGRPSGLPGGRSFGKHVTDFLNSKPMLKVITLPFANALFGNAIPGALELFPGINQLSARYRNSMDYVKVEAAREAAIDAARKAGKTLREALKDKEVKKHTKHMARLRQDGIYDPAELYARMTIGPMVIAAYAAARVAAGDDGTEWDEQKDEATGKVASVRPSLGYFAPYALWGDVLGHQILADREGRESKYSGPEMSQHLFKETMGAVTGSRAALLGPGTSALVELGQGNLPSEDLVKRVAGDLGRAMTSFGWLGEAAGAMMPGDAERDVRTDVGSPWDALVAGAQSNYPPGREGLPPRIDWMVPGPSAPDISMGKRWEDRPVLEEEYNRLRGRISASEFLPRRTQDPEYDALVMKHFKRLRDEAKVDELLKRFDNPATKAEFLRKWVAGLRDNAKELALREYLSQTKGKLPQGMEEKEREKLERKRAFPHPGPARVPAFPRGAVINLDED